LLVKVSMTMESQAGTIPLESYLSDYRSVDGVLMPYKAVIKTIGPERISTVDGIEQNVNLPADRFALPAAIKALIKKNP